MLQYNSIEKIKKNTWIIIIAVVAVVVLVDFYIFFLGSHEKSLPSSQKVPTSQKAPTLGSQIFEKTQNSLQGKLPETNPFKDQKNPLNVIYKNPFK